jgi:polar amino acid transport system substrate-binding protein
VFALVLILGLAQPVLAQNPSMVQSGVLTYGVAATFPPFEYQEGDKLVGFDIELGDALAKKMGLKASPLNMEFKGLIPALQGKRIDIINSAMYIKPERAEQVDFIPYLKVGEEVMVKKGNPKKVSGVDNLCGRSVAVTLGAIEEIYARDFSKKCTDAGKPAIDVKTFPTAPDSVTAVQQDRSDAFFTSTPGASHILQQKPDDFEIVGKTFDANTQIGIAVRKGDAAMKKAVEEALMALVKDGTFGKLLTKYKLPETVMILK